MTTMLNETDNSSFGQIFIAWEQDKTKILADLVKTKLEDRKFSPVLGGEEANPQKMNFYLGAQVLAQLNSASRAIILTSTFRPNLMFEFGYLVSRLKPSNLHVFLIDNERSKLPADLNGIWCETIPRSLNEKDDMKEDTLLADTIIELFIKQIKEYPDESVVALCNWARWKTWLEDMTQGKRATDPKNLGLAILHSIQPALYYDDLEFLRHLLKQMNCTTPGELEKAMSIVFLACDYHDITEDAFSEPKPERFVNLVRSLEATLETIRINDFNKLNLNNLLWIWTELIGNDFLGLCYRRMAQTGNKKRYREDSLKKACRSFKKAKVFLDKLDKMEGELNRTWFLLWKSYVYYNLGRVATELRSYEYGKKILIEARRARTDLITKPQTRNLPTTIRSQLEFELAVTNLYIIKHGYEERYPQLEYIISNLEEKKPPRRPLIMWKRALVQANELADNKNLKTRTEKLRHYCE
jgi:hypothetical protein